MLPASRDASANVGDVPGGTHRRYATQQRAQLAFNRALDSGRVLRIAYVLSREVLSR
jgi:hypothetical protein